MQKQREVILKAQAILAAYLPPDGKSAHEAICELLELLDGPESREALAPAAQDSAPAGLPPLPNPVGAVEWAPSIREFKIEPAYTTGQMLEYGKQWAAFAAATMQAVPVGWKLVPVEPTEEMLSAKPKSPGIQAQCVRSMQRNADRAKYVAMLAAAPASPQPAIVKADTPEYTQYECHHCGSGCTVHKLQPVAKVLTDEEIFSIHDTTNSADSQILAFARAILAASTPTTLTEK